MNYYMMFRLFIHNYHLRFFMIHNKLTRFAIGRITSCSICSSWVELSKSSERLPHSSLAVWTTIDEEFGSGSLPATVDTGNDEVLDPGSWYPIAGDRKADKTGSGFLHASVTVRVFWDGIILDAVEGLADFFRGLRLPFRGRDTLGSYL